MQLLEVLDQSVDVRSLRTERRVVNDRIRGADRPQVAESTTPSVLTELLRYALVLPDDVTCCRDVRSGRRAER
jgi:hypothetical protein